MLNISKFAGIFAVIGFVSPALADDVVLTKTAEPIANSFTKRNLDVLGVRPGMTADAVTEHLKSAYDTEPRITRERIVRDYKGIEIKSADFISEITSSSKDGSEMVSVHFSTPATGSAVIGILRVTQFRDVASSPTVASLTAQITEKYGQPTNYKKWDPYDEFRWAIDASGVNRNCLDRFSRKPGLCDHADPLLRPNELNSVEKNVADGKAYVLEGQIQKQLKDINRASSLTLTIDDEIDKAQDLREAFKQMDKRGDEIDKSDARNQQKTKL